MIDEMTKKQLRIDRGFIAGPYLMLPLSQLAEVRARLDRASIRYWVDQYAITLGSEPPVIVINFGRTGDAARLQALLDEAG